MRVDDFSFELPPELIARFPAPERSASRLMVLDPKAEQVSNHQFTDIIDQVQAGDLMVFNDTRVIPARLFGNKESGGKLEVLVERVLDEHRVLAHIRSSKSPKEGSWLTLEGKIKAQMVARHNALFELKFSGEQTVLELLEECGHIPLPPYIDRPDEQSDFERYQTVYNDKPGAVAAPTAGLHFDEAILNKLKAKGVDFAFVTLHVGAGTFQNLRVEHVTDHKMHSEWVNVSQTVVDQVIATKANGGRVIAVGTTSVRSLESAAQACIKQGRQVPNNLSVFQGETDIFIYPGYQFALVDAIVTNFHLSQSTLLMLVSAFAGKELIERAYQQAIEQRYRFFSYGDAMLISNRKS